ncbi:MAG: hypothetical protein PVS3B1_17480 [Ktedonobacteraceae bacterium]
MACPSIQNILSVESSYPFGQYHGNVKKYFFESLCKVQNFFKQSIQQNEHTEELLLL